MLGILQILNSIPRFIGNYEMIDGGFATDALTQLTGGLVEHIDLQTANLPALKSLMINTRLMNSIGTAGTVS